MSGASRFVVQVAGDGGRIDLLHLGEVLDGLEATGIELVLAGARASAFTRELRAAAAKVFSVTHHRYRVHWIRTALAHLALEERPAVVALRKTIAAHDGAQAASGMFNEIDYR